MNHRARTIQRFRTPIHALLIHQGRDHEIWESSLLNLVITFVGKECM